jgi:predicted phosphate transport protein (TIGR00153 family)
MAFTLFPKSIRFFDMLIKQNQILKEIAADLNLIFGDLTLVDEVFKRINVKEVEADELCREIARQLSQTFITPIDREDIYRINLAQEDSINFLKSIAARTRVSGLSRIVFPAKKMMDNIHLMAIHTGEMIEALKDQQEVSQIVRKIKNLKGECEMLLSTGLSELQDAEITEFKAVVNIIKFVQVYDRIEQVIERIDDLSDAIEEVVLKNA